MAFYFLVYYILLSLASIFFLANIFNLCTLIFCVCIH